MKKKKKEMKFIKTSIRIPKDLHAWYQERKNEKGFSMQALITLDMVAAKKLDEKGDWDPLPYLFK